MAGAGRSDVRGFASGLPLICYFSMGLEYGIIIIHRMRAKCQERWERMASEGRAFFVFGRAGNVPDGRHRRRLQRRQRRVSAPPALFYAVNAGQGWSRA